MPRAENDSQVVRLAELLASLALAIDLGLGASLDHVMKACLLGMQLADRLGLDEATRREVYYVVLLRHIGCTSTAQLTATALGNEYDVGPSFPLMDEADMMPALRYVFQSVGKEAPPLHRGQRLAKFFINGPALGPTTVAQHCEIAERFASKFGFGAGVQQALGQSFERWDGKGLPNHVKNEDIPLSARIAYFVLEAAEFLALYGMEMVRATAQKRAGRHYDPTVVAVFLNATEDLQTELETVSVWEAVLSAEPGSPVWLNDEQLDDALQAIADFTDFKSSWLLGHSRRVAHLSADAATQMGLSTSEVIMIRRAGWLHDVGRVAVSSTIWNKPGPLTDSEWERVRLHPNYTERVFARSPLLNTLGAMAALHHERIDGSGYHRGLPASLLTRLPRLLAAADAYSAMTETRPYRAALTPEAAADELRREVRNGRLDTEAVNAVLKSAGQKAGTVRASPSTDLTPREIEVLRLIARGWTNKQMAHHLVLAEKTIGHHIERLYTKIGVNTRAGTTLFAVQNNLLE